MSDPYVGQIIRVGFTFAPVGWLLCYGQIVAISQFNTLYALIGTTYGGDGQNTFGIPDLRGRVPLGAGQGQGLSPYVLGQMGGSEYVALSSSQMPQHRHYLQSFSVPGSAGGPSVSANLSDEGPGGISSVFTYAPYDAANQTSISGAAISPTPDGSIPHENRQPLLAVQYCICVSGIFPPHG
jgi:microcystin-dependent protein